jgi:hypothetical protein
VVHRSVGRPSAPAKQRCYFALILCVALLVGCGGSSSSKPEPRKLPQPSLPASIQVADCSDWREGSVEQRRGTIIDLHEFAGGQVGSSAALQKGNVLNDERAYALLDRACRKRFARAFKLYKLYERAAAFTGQQESSSTLGGGP